MSNPDYEKCNAFTPEGCGTLGYCWGYNHILREQSLITRRVDLNNITDAAKLAQSHKIIAQECMARGCVQPNDTASAAAQSESLASRHLL